MKTSYFSNGKMTDGWYCYTDVGIKFVDVGTFNWGTIPLNSINLKFTKWHWQKFFDFNVDQNVYKSDRLLDDMRNSFPLIIQSISYNIASK